MRTIERECVGSLGTDHTSCLVTQHTGLYYRTLWLRLDRADDLRISGPGEKSTPDLHRNHIPLLRWLILVVSNSFTGVIGDGLYMKAIRGSL